MKYTLVLISSIFLFTSCKKKEDTTIITSTGITTVPVLATVPTTENIVMYEVNLRAFPGGNFQGVKGRLDEMQALGVNVIWLMPIFPIGQINSVNSPYCVKNYKEVNSEFGSLEDFKLLVAAAHSRGMAVILDWVANHTSWDNPWISNISWYTQDGFGNIISPAGTNWSDVADLNFDNANMRLEMIEAMKYWINSCSVDGFRCDAADMVPFAFWQQAITELNSIPDRDLIFLAEGERVDHFLAGFHLNYAWSYYTAVKSVFIDGTPASSLYQAHADEYSILPAGARKLRFTTNQDESAWDATPIALFGSTQAATAASVITCFMKGTPMIYGSQEVGRSAPLSFFGNDPINWSMNGAMRQDYERIFSFYSSSNAAKQGSLVNYANNDCVVLRRVLTGEEVLIIVNTRNSAIEYSSPAALTNSIWTNAIENTSYTIPATLDLGPYEWRIYKK